MTDSELVTDHSKISIGDGVNTGIENIRRPILKQQRNELSRFLTHAQLKLYGGLSTIPGGFWKLIGLVSRVKQLLGL